ncbi:peptidoglycan glycosyltransferase [Jannaschia pagri]|uniref:Peptidoglycan glycosyltransferase n=1 Tax=Jannaschia pagri TaxID=2829797 RepID=A0ABQ4NJL7_9RHOB|nr:MULTISPECIES: penicillin-binding protein 2 [unclassified Jannaschia]GIT90778.1 peptidoglycan glycosyltransferase [Jannaschia sp. AI_61]GIT94610.1 peptidoglycan glycosyltransferase [Jannaschia sp. AI_62]
MKRNAEEQRLSTRHITRRALILGGAQAAFGALLVGRMNHLQVDQADEFLLLAEENRIKVRLLAPARGVIYDRHGRILAGNEQIYRVSMIREDADDVDEVVTHLRGLVRLDEDTLQRALREMDRRPHQAVTIADRLSWEELSTIAVNVPSLPGVTPEVGLSRVYPLGRDYAHVIGYVGRVSDRDLENEEDRDPLLQTPQFQIGKIGAERSLEHVLRGKAGSRRVEQNAAGRIMRELGRTPGQSGKDVQLTIDAGLQNFTQARLGLESASTVVMDVRNGDVLAAVSSPSYDPNLFVTGISVPDYAELRDNDHRPLHNKIVQGLYPPGSTFKMITLLAALEAGEVSPSETFYCPGHLTVSNRRFHCWKRGGHGWVDAAKSLRESCDVYYYELAQKAGIDRISEMARRLGLGAAHPLEMTSVSEGLVPDRDWKRTRRGEEWVVGDSLNASIGQGFVLASPLQLAVMTARLASGLSISPRLVRSVDGQARPSGVNGPLGINRSLLDLVRDGMYQVNNSRGGTARGSRFDMAGMKWAGKTGTSQVRNITAAERARGVFRNEDLPWNRRDHALYVGYAPYDDPRYAISVVVEHGGGGSKAAAPIARDVMLYALSGGIPPLDAYPRGQRGQAEALLSSLNLNPELGQGPGSSEA